MENGIMGESNFSYTVLGKVLRWETLDHQIVVKPEGIDQKEITWEKRDVKFERRLGGLTAILN